MGFSFKPFKAITRAVGIPDKVATAIFPIARAAEIATGSAIRQIQNLIQPQGRAAATQQFAPSGYDIAPGYAPPPAYSVYFADSSIYGGGPSWDFSTDFSGMPWGNSRVTLSNGLPGTSWGDYLLLSR